MDKIISYLPRIAKALSAAVTAGMASYGTALQDGFISVEEWLMVAAGALVAGLAVWAVPNEPQAKPE